VDSRAGRSSTLTRSGRNSLPCALPAVSVPTTPTKPRSASTVRSRLSWKLGSSSRSSSRPASECSTRAESDCSGSDSELGSPRALLSAARARVGSSAGRADAIIIFDWDDTFLPTSVIRSQRSRGSKPLCTKELESHAKLVERVLRAARAVGKVSIVTLSKNSWVFKSAERFLPGVDFPALFDELEITIHYAQEEEKNCPGALMAEDWVGLKRSSMQGCLNAWSEKGAFASAPRPTVISIGDSDAEQQALKTLIHPRRPLCKTVKFMDEPTLDELGRELIELPSLLESMVTARKDFDISITKPSELAPRARVLGL